MPLRSRLGVLLLGGAMLAHAALPAAWPRALPVSCRHPFALRDLLRGQPLPLVICGSEARSSARALLRRLEHPCVRHLRGQLWLDSGDLLEVRRDCGLVRARLRASRRLALGLRVEINDASVEDLEALPRIGPALARRIVRLRGRSGPFTSIEDLRRVRGIGAHTMATLRPYVRCERSPRSAKKR